MSDLLNSASLVLIPSGYKEDTVYSVVPSDGSGDLSFTRASNGTRINSAGLVEDCPWNLAQYSEEFNNAYWGKLNATATANATTAPNGTTTADRITDDSVSGSHYISSSAITVVNGSTYTLSVYLKANTLSWVRLELFSGGCFFDLTNGVLGTASGATASITSVGNGWYNCVITVVSASTSAYPTIRLSTGNGVFGYVGSGSSVYAWGAQLNIGSTAKPYFPTTDRLNIPRLTYQNGGGGCPSLLLEKQSTNLFSYSEQFDNAAWTKGLVSISANTTTSPDGTQNADSIIDNTTNSRHVMEQAITGDLSISRSFSLYAKQNTLRYLYMSVTNAGDTHCYSAIFDLQSGTVSATKVNGSATITASIQSVGNGWYRCTITGTMTSGTATFYPLIGTSDRGGFTGTLVNNNAPSYAGSGQSLFIWGAQLEASSYPTSYIPTTSASATRVADACFKTGISSLIGQTEGTVFLELDYSNISGLNMFLSIRPDASNKVEVYRDGAVIYGEITAGSSFAISATKSMGTHKIAFAYKSGSSALYIDGVLISENTTSFSFSTTLASMSISSRIDRTYSEAANYKEVILFKTRLTNAELASLTTL